MRLLKITKVMLFVTGLSLIYIHLQMQIFDLAYQGKTRERTIRQYTERNGTETYNILKLKSSNHLGVQLLAENSDLKFLDNRNVVDIETPEVLLAENEMVLLSSQVKKPNPIMKIFSLRSAEAKTQE